jgi:glucosyl-3-phosphoglycerate synthase
MSLNNHHTTRMLLFDMDDTLLKGRFIDVCAEQFNFRQALNLLRQIDRNAVSLTQRIASFLQGKTKDELIDIVKTIPLVDDIIDVTAVLKKRGYKIGIISDSYQVITQYVGERIGADFSLANELQFDNGYLTGEVLIPSYFHYSEESTCRHQVCKTNALRYASHKYNVPLSQCIVVGDSDNDICMLQHAGLGVAFCATEALKNVAAKKIDKRSFVELLDYAW